MVAILKDIKRSRESEDGFDLASLAIPPIGGDLANGDAFLLWDALGRESNCPSLISLLGLQSKDSTRVTISKKMKALHTMSKNFTRDMLSVKKKGYITARLCDLLFGKRPTRHPESSIPDEVCI
jgi:hypothetical protein